MCNGGWIHCKPIPCNENRVFPVKFSHREIPVMKTGDPAMRTRVPCKENRLFPVWKTSQGKPCSGPVLILYRIAVYIWWLEFHNSSHLFQKYVWSRNKNEKVISLSTRKIHSYAMEDSFLSKWLDDSVGVCLVLLCIMRSIH